MMPGGAADPFVAGHGVPPQIPVDPGAGPQHPAIGEVVNRVAPPHEPPAPAPIPRELSKVSLPLYTVGPPDVLLVEAIKTVPKEPYKIERLDQLQIQVEGALEDRPIQGTFAVGPNGTVDLGPPYGLVKVVGLTTEEAREAIEETLNEILQQPLVTVSLAQPSAVQQITGEHLIGPDGTINLGTYGRVYVNGKTVAQVQEAIEERLSEKLEDPEVAVDVFSYNSKSYYLILEGFERGDAIRRTPITGNETVLDAIAAANGLSTTSSRTRIWVARPSPDHGPDQILPVDYHGIVMRGDTSTNYQLMPGDRVYIAEDRLSTFDATIGRLIAPFERLFGFSLLGAQTVQTLNRFPQGFRTSPFF